jgi:hypothetical protein
MDPSVGFKFNAQNDAHSRHLETNLLHSVSKQVFAERARELFRLAREEADRLGDELYDLDPNGMHATPFFQLVFPAG